MTWQQEFWSWMSPSYIKTAQPPAIGDKAPTVPKLTVPKDGKPTIIAFLRHCGCPCTPSHFRACPPTDTVQLRRRRSSTCATQLLRTPMFSLSPSRTATKARPTAGSLRCPIHQRIPSPILKSSWTPNGKRTLHTASVFPVSTTSSRLPD